MTSGLRAYAARTDGFAAGTDSPVQALEDHCAAITQREGEVNAFVCTDLDAARAAAVEAEARWRSGQPLSPLDGMPFAVKDIIETADFPTAQGVPMLEGERTGRDSASVRALREAGAVIVGKTTTTEFASTELFAATRNPHDLTRTPGGSSSGSAAAVGAGMVPLALASQVVGSTLRPASYNGAFGYKPTTHGLNRGGAFDYLSQSCVGLIGAGLADIWLATRAIASRVGGDPGHVGVLGPDTMPAARRPTRLALLQTDGWDLASAGARSALDTTLGALRSEGIEIVDRGSCRLVAALESAIEQALDKTWRVLVWEMQWPLNTYGARGANAISPAMQQRLAEGRAMTQDDYARALSDRGAARQRLSEVMQAYDAVFTLGATGAAPDDFTTTGDPSFNVPTSYLGAPGLSLPLLADGHMPLGLQVIGAQRADAALFATARWIEETLK